MNITITGNLGAGKTSVCGCLEQQGFEVISAGKIFREVAAEKGISVLEMNKLAKTDRSIDVLIDERSARLGKEKDNAVFDSRMAWNFIPDSFKVFLLVDTEEAAKRVFSDKTRDTEKYAKEEDAVLHLYERAMLEQERFKELYGVDYFSVNNYNLIIDSTGVTPEQVAGEILSNFEQYKEEPFYGRVELCISNIYPTKSAHDLNSGRLQECVDMEKQSDSLCALETIPVTSKNGYVYMKEGHHRTFGAANAGKAFTKVSMTDHVDKAVMSLSASEIYDFEDIGKFKYRYYPKETPKRKGYLFNFGFGMDR